MGDNKPEKESFWVRLGEWTLAIIGAAIIVTFASVVVAKVDAGCGKQKEKKPPTCDRVCEMYTELQELREKNELLKKSVFWSTNTSGLRLRSTSKVAATRTLPVNST